MLPSDRGDRRRLLGLAAAGGFAVMLVEVCAFRSLQVTLGSTVYVTGIVLATVMVALAAGYALGGVLSRARSAPSTLAWVLAATSASLLLLDVLLVDAVLDQAFAWRNALSRGGDAPTALAGILPAAAAAGILLGPPLTLLGMVSPLAMARLHGDGTGRVGGLVMAVSTLGSLAGTLLPTFLLLPLLGVRATVLAGAVLLAAAAALAAPRQRAVLAAVSVLLVAASALAVAGRRRGGDVVVEEESQHGSLRITWQATPGGRRALVYAPSRVYVHSVVYPDAPGRFHWTAAHAVPAVAARGHRHLVLGSALGGVVADLVALDARVTVTAVEIDPAVSRHARRLVPAMASPRVRVVADDARAFLKGSRERWDYIVVDLFAGDQAPVHCVTTEFFTLARARLAPGGLLYVNTNAPDLPAVVQGDRPSSIAHLRATLRAAGFPTVLQSDAYGGGMVIAGETSLPELQAGLVRLALSPDAPPAFAVAAVHTALALKEPPRTPARAFSDDWVPEDLLHRKDDPARAARRLAHVELRGDGPDVLAARLLQGWLRAEGMTRADHARTPDAQEVCARLVDWVRATPVADVAPRLARSGFPLHEASACAPALGAAARRDGPHGGANGVFQWLSSLGLAQMDHPELAWPHARAALEILRPGTSR